MPTKEVNDARMTGVLPSQGADPIPVGKIPDGATQVSKSGAANNTTTTIHTVNDGNTLYLCLATFTPGNLSGASAFAQFIITNSSDTEQYKLADLRMADGDGKSLSLSFMPPLEIPTGYKITVYGSADNMIGMAYIFGYEA